MGGEFYHRVLTTYVVGGEITLPSPFVIEGKYCNYMGEAWLSLFKLQAEIKNIVPKTYYGLFLSPSGNFTEENLKYISGVPVTTPSDFPKGTSTYQLPKQLVAKFKTHKANEVDTVPQTIDYIYGYWLPNSDYERGPGNDYEVFENVDDFRNPNLTSSYVIPLVPKK